MKKLLCLVCALALILCGCSGNAGAASTVAAASQPASSVAEAADSVAESVAQPDAPAEITRGVYENGTYTNDSLGVTITVPDTYVVLSDDQLMSLVTANADGRGYDNFQELLDSSAVTYDFGMVQSATGNSIIVGVENLEVEGAAGMIKSIDEYMPFAQAGMNSAQGMQYTFSDIYKVNFASGEWAAMDASEATTGVTSTMYARLSGDYVISIIANIANANEDVVSLIQ